MIVRELFTRMGMKTDAASFQRAGSSLDKVKKIAATIAGILIGGRIVSGFKNIILSTTAAADSVAKMSKRLGVNAQALQELQYAAQIAGATQQDLSTGMRMLQKFADEAAQGTKEYTDEFKRLGVTVKDSSGKMKPAEQIFTEIADGMAGLETATERTAIAQKLLGRGGAALVPLFAEGSAGIRALREEAQTTGGIFSGEFLQASEDMTDQLLRLKMSGIGLKVMLTTALLPAVNAIVSWLTKTYKATREMVKGTRVLQVAFGLLAAAATVLVFVLGFKLLGAVGALALSLVGLASGLTTAGVAAFLLQIKMVAIGAVFILLAALIFLLAEEIVGAFTGMDTAGGLLSDTLGELYDMFMQAGKKSPWLEAALLPLKLLMTFVVRSKDALFALITMLQDVQNLNFSGFSELWDDLRKDADGFWKAQQRIGGALFGGLGAGASAAPGVLPRPQVAAAGAGGGANLVNAPTNNIEVSVQAMPGQSAEDLGVSIAEAIDRRMDEKNTTALQALTPAKVTP